MWRILIYKFNLILVDILYWQVALSRSTFFINYLNGHTLITFSAMLNEKDNQYARFFLKKISNYFNCDGTKGHYSEGEYNRSKYNILNLGNKITWLGSSRLIAIHEKSILWNKVEIWDWNFKNKNKTSEYHCQSHSPKETLIS